MMDHNEFGRQGGGRHRSLDGVRKKKLINTAKKYDYTQS